VDPIIWVGLRRHFKIECENEEAPDMRDTASSLQERTISRLKLLFVTPRHRIKLI
jgi:hypothetical protein